MNAKPADQLDRLIREIVREELANAAPTPLLRLPHGSWGLGSKRREAELARTRQVEAVKLGGRWLATRAAVETYLAAHGEQPPEIKTTPAVEKVDELVAATRAAARRRGARK